MSASEFENSTYRAMFQWLPLPVILLDEGFFIVLANPAAAELLHLRKTGPHSFASVVRKRNAEDLIRPPQTLKITARRLLCRLGLRSRSRVEEFRLLLIQEVTSEVILQEQLVEAERLAGMGQLAAGIAHAVRRRAAVVDAVARPEVVHVCAELDVYASLDDEQ